MAEEAKKEETPAEGTPADGGKKKKLIIIGAAAAGGLLILGVAAFFLFGGSGAKQEPAADGSAGHGTGEAGKAEGDGHGAKEPAKTEGGHDSGKKEDAAKPDAAKEKKEGASEAKGDPSKDKKPAEGFDFGDTFILKPFNLNLGNPLENRFVRLELAIEYKGGESQKKELEARTPQIRDAVVAVASRKTREFLLGPDGKDQLRLELLNRINQYVDKKVNAVFITDILIE